MTGQGPPVLESGSTAGVVILWRILRGIRQHQRCGTRLRCISFMIRTSIKEGRTSCNGRGSCVFEEVHQKRGLVAARRAELNQDRLQSFDHLALPLLGNGTTLGKVVVGANGSFGLCGSAVEPVLRQLLPCKGEGGMRNGRSIGRESGQQEVPRRQRGEGASAGMGRVDVSRAKGVMLKAVGAWERAQLPFEFHADPLSRVSVDELELSTDESHGEDVNTIARRVALKGPP